DGATSGPVRVTVIGQDGSGDPEAGAIVLFHAPDGSLAARATTDASGIAEAELERGGAITVVRPRDGVALLTTIAAVEPGDELSVGGSTVTPDLPPIGTMTVTVPDLDT